jgi:hypothetical protein
MIYLWAVKNLLAAKATLTDAPTSKLFNNRAQEIM